MFKFSESSLSNMQGVHSDLVLVFKEAIKFSPVDFGVPKMGGMRSAKDQHDLFLRLVSKCDGYKIKSKHQSGMALDFYAYVNGRASWEKHHLAMIAGVIMATAEILLEEGKITHRLIWGGTFGSKDFNGWDMPHFELKEV